MNAKKTLIVLAALMLQVILLKSTFGQVTQARSKIVSIDGVKVVVVPYVSFNTILLRLLVCDSISADNGYNVAIISTMEEKMKQCYAAIAKKDTLIANLTENVKADSIIASFDRAIIAKQQEKVKKEQLKVKIIGGIGITVLILSLLL